MIVAAIYIGSQLRALWDIMKELAVEGVRDGLLSTWQHYLDPKLVDDFVRHAFD